jgi:hypothetical protein
MLINIEQVRSFIGIVTGQAVDVDVHSTKGRSGLVAFKKPPHDISEHHLLIIKRNQSPHTPLASPNAHNTIQALAS